MFRTLSTIAAVTGALVAGTAAIADSWTLNEDSSLVAFGSIKKDTVGESHAFETVSGTVSADGTVAIEIDLTSVQTNIDIRNERMMEHVFNGIGTATISAAIDMSGLEGLAIGGTDEIYTDATLSFLAADIPLELDLFVMRLSQDQVLVTSNGMTFVSTEDLGIEAGIDTLMELADLPGITRTTPIMLRLIFDADVEQAEAAPVAPVTEVVTVAVTGDAEAGARLFRQCRACHSLNEGRNGVGPSLHGLIGATAGQVDGFRYSDAMAASGVIWGAGTLDGFLADPRGYVDGTSMAYRGMGDAEDRQNLIAYLARESG
ncbi:c-type cytochrome [Pontivivens insulae]|uniref:Cytochrome c-552 n=1 Tax=Pontivivens insulae TaxID=1639689 RepID=A0A2R8A811_9RHOB|nr:cytochrome c family protein [Pontivivens insulae]RED18397.1 cytochrome c2 [Pontivivens insulae]SPF28295.1 Cytochrome c-552 [Pontivivens insulae]